MMLYCLEIIRAYPDVSYPCASVSVHHFKTIAEADDRRREEKRKYYNEFEQFLNDETIDVDKYDEYGAKDFIYKECSMAMEPFTSNLYEIEIEEDRILSRRISFPKTDRLEV